MGYVFKLEIWANTKAFGSVDQARLAEVARCLRRTAHECETGSHVGAILDASGATVGTFVLIAAPS